MYLIDKTKKEFKDVPTSLDGEVLLEKTKDTQGNITGYLTVKPEFLKHLSETMTQVELKTAGYGKFQRQLDFVKGKSDIIAKKPKGIEI